MLVLFLTAMLAGMFNAIAGGGSFLTFPMLIVLGLPAVEANATSTIGLWFGIVASAFTYRQFLLDPAQAAVSRSTLFGFMLVSLLGGTIGALLLLRLPESIFTGLVPYLMLFAATLFTFNPVINQWLKTGGRSSQLPTVMALGLQLIISIYGGYFGGGASILMLAVMSFMGLSQIHAMNGMKCWLGAIMNTVAIALFITAGKIVWQPAMIMAIGSTIGAYTSATIAQKVSPKILRGVIVAIAWAMTIYLFWKARQP
jgi:uncharacterized protein